MATDDSHDPQSQQQPEQTPAEALTPGRTAASDDDALEAPGMEAGQQPGHDLDDGTEGDPSTRTGSAAAADAPGEVPGAGTRTAAVGASRPLTSGEGGKRVTRRTIHRRETEEHTEETITEDLPAYQGPASAHPAPVG